MVEPLKEDIVEEIDNLVRDKFYKVMRRLVRPAQMID